MYFERLCSPFCESRSGRSAGARHSTGAELLGSSGRAPALLLLFRPKANANACPIRVNALLIKPIRVPMLPLLSGMDHH